MRGLYPDLEPYQQHQLPVGGGHSLYIEECGNPDGQPVVFLHGGPGAGAGPAARRFFDPNRYRILVFDQRGCGRSTPNGRVEHNTLTDLIADLETIREHLCVDRWVLFGGSWGSTLALAYAQDFPGRVKGLILRGVFLGRRQDLEWFIGPDGAARLFPDYYADFTAAVAPRVDLADAFFERMFGDNELQARQAASAWTYWESRIATLVPNPFFTKRFAASKGGQTMARIECHYFRDACGLSGRAILDRADRLADIPSIIVQGRQDVVCPPDGAYALHRAWPNSQLQLIPGAAHSASEAPLVDALVRATDQFARL
ncbi:prolyl aminopeptidase [Litorivicinus lipolyticus]|uniref:Proline iminopeptidase n=1 Tax=Litorivicinus lipolyticus TaxID=418701 RepID=A0A5Q2QJF9_9GAMM|nr:prolyl aminopeptidase [Litorivicinus lipolyticus]QGG81215.1 prolyl aminopeptidase [Litorivicinus lipolyticus]